jgi:uncharacterized protein
MNPWQATLDRDGVATLGPLLSNEDCDALAGLYAEDRHFRSRVVMARHGFGSGEYKYFTNPLPELVKHLRTTLYPPLAALANRWRGDAAFPATHPDYLAQCHRAGQTRPTPLLLCYGPGDYNCLHQDLYGDLYFPLQVVVLLSQPGEDFTGGELVLTEQRPRRQSRAHVMPLQKGEAAVFAVNKRPVGGARGVYQVTMRHGVSTVRSGQRFTLGIIFHDAA